MNSYEEIDKLFGTPLNQIAKPKVPFKIKTWHWVTGGLILAAASYGVYSLCKDVKSKFSYKEQDSKTNNNAKFTAKNPSTSDKTEEIITERNKTLSEPEKNSVKVK